MHLTVTENHGDVEVVGATSTSNHESLTRVSLANRLDAGSTSRNQPQKLGMTGDGDHVPPPPEWCPPDIPFLDAATPPDAVLAFCNREANDAHAGAQEHRDDYEAEVNQLSAQTDAWFERLMLPGKSARTSP